MSKKSNQRLYKQLQRYSQSLHRKSKVKNNNWKDSPFAWIRRRNSRTRGKIFEKLAAKLCSIKGFQVSPAKSSQHDFRINNYRIEVKGSTLWTNGTYRFQQLRNQNYDLIICLGISPYELHCWVIPKDVFIQQWRKGNIKSQHGGSRGKDTAMLVINPNKVPAWIQRYGGSLSKGLRVLSKSIR